MDPMEINDAQVKNRLTLYETNEKLHSMQHFAKLSISLQTNTWDQLQLERALSSPELMKNLRSSEMSFDGTCYNYYIRSLI